MSFLNRAGSLLKQNVCKHISSVSSVSSPSLSQATRCMPSSDVTEILVEGFTEDVDAGRLKEAFSKYGSVIDARAFTEDGTYQGYGFVTYETMEAASIAIQEFNGKLVQGRKIRVTFATEERPSGGGYGGRGGNQGGGNYSGGDRNYSGDVSNGGGNQFSGGGGGGYGETKVPLGGD